MISVWIILLLMLIPPPPYLIAEGGNSDKDAVVTLKQGNIQGLSGTSRAGKRYFAFLGIPYGKVPERFGLPQEGDSWNGVKMATEMAPHCIQFCYVLGKIRGIEDCLTLNVYSRKLDGKQPVMVLIHGGGFQFGSGNFLEAKYFMDEEVVLVTIQYRLGALGFLSTEDDVVPGNMGMKDVVVALKWIQENIEHFGGDRESVTVFGYSSGGSSVHYQMLSPMSKGLFHRAISESGTVLNPWAIQLKPKLLNERLCKVLKCPVSDTIKMVECLRSKKPEEIITAQLSLRKFPAEFDVLNMLFLPVVEKGSAEPKFLPDTPYALVTSDQISNPVPWIIGDNADEGAFFTANMVESPESLQRLNKDWNEMIPNILYLENTVDPSNLNYVLEKIKNFYFPQGTIKQEDYLKLGQLFGDRFFVNGVSRAIREHAKRPDFPIYPYYFNYSGSQSIVQGMLRASRSYGIAHTDELKYLFNRTFMSHEFGLDTKDGKFSTKFVKLFVSFARDGKPTETWGNTKSWESFKLYRNEGNRDKPSPIPWYVIDEETKILEDAFKERVDFWESLPLTEMENEVVGTNS